MCPLGDRIGDDSVDADSGQEKRDTGEGDEKENIEAPALESVREQFPHHSYLGYWLLRVNLQHGIGQLLVEAPGIWSRANSPADRHRPDQQGSQVRGNLGERRVDLGGRRIVRK